jgi:hypothetical protein
MANSEVIFKVHYGGRFDRRNKCTYVGGQIGLYEESYNLDCLSFFEIETVARKFGYQSGDLVYYRIPERELDDGLVLLTSVEDVVGMAEVYLGHTLVILYTVSFANAGAEVGANEGEGEGEGEEVAESGNEERRMKVINDPYWQALMSDDDDAWDGADDQKLVVQNVMMILFMILMMRVILMRRMVVMRRVAMTRQLMLVVQVVRLLCLAK